MARTDQGKRPRGMAATYLAAMILGLLAIQLAIFFMTFRFRTEDQFQLAVADRSRLAATMYEAFAPLSPSARLTLAAGLEYSSFEIHVVAEPGFESGSDYHSRYFADVVQSRLDVVTSQTTGQEKLPEVRARLDNFSVNWGVFPYSNRSPAGRESSGRSEFNALVSIELDQGQWLLLDFKYIMRVDNNLLGLILELLAQFLLILILAAVVIHYVTKPLRQLADYADQFVPEISGPQPVSLPDKGPSEVLRTSRAMQAMAERIRRYIDQRVRMLASISHDLRNPIHLMRLYLEKDVSHSHQDQLLEALDDLQRLADDAVTLARTGVNNEALRVTDLRALLGSLVDDYTEYLTLRLGEEQGADMVRFHPQDKKINCRLRPLTFKRCVQNIIDNAVRYGHEADVYLEENDQRVTIRIVDKGPGIPEHLLNEVFQPFFRHDASRSSDEGNGLGLSIAHDLALQNNAEISCRNLPQGGLEVRIGLSPHE